MIRNLKALGLALVAIFAMSAVAASAASAQQGELKSDGPVTLTATETGLEQNRLTAFNAFVECPGSHYTGHKVLTVKETEEGKEHQFLPASSTTATITPEYTETVGGKPNCKGTLGTSATVDMNGCDYVVHIGSTTGDQPATGATYGATFDIVCPANQEITVTVWITETQHTNDPKAENPRCVIHVPPQTGLTGAHATDTNIHDGHVELNGTAEGITMNITRNSILCPGAEEPHETNGKFDLDVTVEGHDEDLEPTDIALSHS